MSIVFKVLKGLAKRILPKSVLARINNYPLESIHAAIKEEKLLPLYHRLSVIVPDIVHQYSHFDLDTEFWVTNVRAMHAFQIDLVNEALQSLDSPGRSTKPVTIVDIGDSAGTHIQYIKGLYPERNFRCLSVNLEKAAVERIKQKGLEAICARAEDLASLSVDADIFLSFEMIEHLMNPCEFLHNLSDSTNCKAFVITVPYVAQSRVGLRHIRLNQPGPMDAETTHIFELSPEDWRLVFRHSGWEVQSERIYLQYPRKSPFTFLLKRYWRECDFEGYYGAILKPDKRWSDLYSDW